MRAIELKAEITSEGHIVLPEPLRNLYGSHARMILLLEEPAEEKKHQYKMLALRGVMEDSTDFDEAMRDMEKAWQQWQP